MYEPPVWRVPVSPTHCLRCGLLHPATLWSVGLSARNEGTADASSGDDPRPHDLACVPGQALDGKRRERDRGDWGAPDAHVRFTAVRRQLPYKKI